MLYHHITELIGNTPLLQIDPAVHQLANVELYAKAEQCIKRSFATSKISSSDR